MKQTDDIGTLISERFSNALFSPEESAWPEIAGTLGSKPGWKRHGFLLLTGTLLLTGLLFWLALPLEGGGEVPVQTVPTHPETNTEIQDKPAVREPAGAQLPAGEATPSGEQTPYGRGPADSKENPTGEGTAAGAGTPHGPGPADSKENPVGEGTAAGAGTPYGRGPADSKASPAREMIPEDSTSVKPANYDTRPPVHAQSKAKGTDPIPPSGGPDSSGVNSPPGTAASAAEAAWDVASRSGQGHSTGRYPTPAVKYSGPIAGDPEIQAPKLLLTRLAVSQTGNETRDSLEGQAGFKRFLLQPGITFTVYGLPGNHSAIDPRLRGNPRRNTAAPGAGLALIFPISPNWTLRTGLAYIPVASETTGVPLIPGDPATNYYGRVRFEPSLNYLAFSQGFDAPERLNLREELGYLLFPLEILYIFKPGGPVDFYAISGMGLSTQIQNDLYAIGASGRQRLGSNTNYSKAAFGLHFGVGLAYRAPPWEFHLEPVMRPQLGFYENTDIRNPVLYNLNLGIRIRL